MGVGVDGDAAAKLLGQAEVAVVEIEPFGGRVMLDGYAQSLARRSTAPISIAKGSRRSRRRPVG